MSIRDSMKETITDMLENTIEKYDYMYLVSIQLKIKTGFYDDYDAKSLIKEIEFLSNYKKSYPHIIEEIDQVIDYLNGIVTMQQLNNEEAW